MVRNFAEFARYPWAAQCLEMARRTGGQHSNYESDAFGGYIIRGEFHKALQRTSSVGRWRDNVHGKQYWVDICIREFGHC